VVKGSCVPIMILRNVNQRTKWTNEMLEFLNSLSFEDHIGPAVFLIFAIAANHVINKKERNNLDTDNYFRIIASALIPLFICLLIGVGVAGIAEDFKRWMVSFFVIYFAYQTGRLSMAAHTKKPE
jgi:hypothetical protein